jgi:hypothetical protein
LKILFSKVLFIFLLFSSCSNTILLNQYIDLNLVKSKISSAQDGDTVYLPEGVIYLKEGIIVQKNINIIGAGIDKTIILSQVNEANKAALTIVGNESGVNKIRISGLSIRGNAKINSAHLLRISGTCKNFRIDNCKFENGYGPQTIKIFGLTYGVIDHCQFINDSGESINIMADNSVWTDAPALGGADAVYIEDCVFNKNMNMETNCVASNLGSRYVFRYNTVSVKGDSSYPLLDCHGNFDITGGYGAYSAEIYGNKIYSNSGSYYCIFIRGGKGVIYNNTITGNVDMPICFTEYRATQTKAQYLKKYPGRTLFPHWTELADEKVGGVIEGAQITKCPDTAYDQLNDYCDNVYPAPNQVNNYYLWGNTYNGTAISDGTPVEYVMDRGLDKYHLQKGRDYYDVTSKPSSYTAYTYPHPLTL